MKKNFALLSLIFVFSFGSPVMGQVGVNTTNPNTSLDVQASRNSNGVIDNNQYFGIQAPRISRAELTNHTKSYGTDQNGALIYINDISAGDALATSPREFVTSVGYYYFESSSNKWRRLSDNTNSLATSAIKAENGLTATADNIVKLGGTLKEATKITQGTNNFVFQGTNAADNAAFNTYTNVNINTDPNNTTSPTLRVAHPVNTLNPALLLSGVNNSSNLAIGQASFIGFNPNGKDGYWPIGIGAEYINTATGQGSADFFIATSAGGTAAKKFVVTNAGNVGINTSKPDNSAYLDITGTKGGLLPPRLSASDRATLDALGADKGPANGLVIYNTTDSVLQVNKGSKQIPNWTSLGEGGTSPAPTTDDVVWFYFPVTPLDMTGTLGVTIDLYPIYQTQLATPLELTYTKDQLEFVVLGFDAAAFAYALISDDGKGGSDKTCLFYRRKPQGKITDTTYLNIAIKIKKK